MVVEEIFDIACSFSKPQFYKLWSTSFFLFTWIAACLGLLGSAQQGKKINFSLGDVAECREIHQYKVSWSQQFFPFIVAKQEICSKICKLENVIKGVDASR